MDFCLIVGKDSGPLSVSKDKNLFMTFLLLGTFWGLSRVRGKKKPSGLCKVISRVRNRVRTTMCLIVLFPSTHEVKRPSHDTVRPSQVAADWVRGG